MGHRGDQEDPSRGDARFNDEDTGTSITVGIEASPGSIATRKVTAARGGATRCRRLANPAVRNRGAIGVVGP